MGLRIDRRYEESITIAEANGRTTTLTRLFKVFNVVEKHHERTRTSTLRVRLNSLAKINDAVSIRVRDSSRGAMYLSCTVFAPDDAVISRTEQLR